MRAHHAWVVLLKYTVTARLVYRPMVKVCFIGSLLRSALMLKAYAPLTTDGQPHVSAYLLLIKPAATVIAIYHILTSIYKKTPAFASVLCPFFTF